MNGNTFLRRSHTLFQQNTLKGPYRSSRSFVSTTRSANVCRLCGNPLKLLRNPTRLKFIRFKATVNGETEGKTREKVMRLLSLAHPERWRIGGLYWDMFCF